jgi:hypothetical protein
VTFMDAVAVALGIAMFLILLWMVRGIGRI